MSLWKVESDVASDKPNRKDGLHWRYVAGGDYSVRTASLPKHFPWDTKDWKAPTEKRWAPPDKAHPSMPKRNMYRDPNHPTWDHAYSLLKWWTIKIRLIGSDPEGRQIVAITKGVGEPIYLRFGHTIDIYRNGEKIA